MKTNQLEDDGLSFSHDCVALCYIWVAAKGYYFIFWVCLSGLTLTPALCWQPLTESAPNHLLGSEAVPGPKANVSSKSHKSPVTGGLGVNSAVWWYHNSCVLSVTEKTKHVIVDMSENVIFCFVKFYTIEFGLKSSSEKVISLLYRDSSVVIRECDWSIHKLIGCDKSEHSSAMRTTTTIRQLQPQTRGASVFV